MSNTLAILAGIKNIVSATLGVSYSELTHVLSLEKNRFDGASQRYGVIPQAQSETSGTTQANTIDQTFAIVLTDSYISSALTDSGIIDKIVELMGKFEDINKQLVIQKAGVPSVLFVGDFAISEALVVEEDKLIIIEGRVNVRSKKSFL